MREPVALGLMSVAPYVLAALILLAAHLRDERRDRRDAQAAISLATERHAWTMERQELLNRIQAPHMVPVTARQDQEVEPPEDDGWDLVGTIVQGEVP